MKTSDNIDPVSGNEIPVGSSAEEVRDDIDAKLSEGEYVVPADVVKFFGVEYFEKLRIKAKKGLADMDKEGRIGGEPSGEEFNQGGMVSPNLSAMIDNAKIHAAKNPEFAQMLAAKGISIRQDAPSTKPVEGNMGTPIKMNEGGLVTDWEKVFEGQTPPTQSDFDPSQYQPGFSSLISATPNTITQTSNTVCGPGTVWDEKSQMCVPEVSQQTVQPTVTDNVDESQSPVEPNKWMEKYDYSNPEVLRDQTMTTLGSGPEEEMTKGQNLLNQVGGFLGDAVQGGLVGGVLGKMVKSQRYAEAMANAEILRSQGYETEALQVETSAKSYADEHDIKKGGLFDPTRRLIEGAKTRFGQQTEDNPPSRPTRTNNPPPTQNRDPNRDDRSPSSKPKTNPTPSNGTAGASDKYVGRTDSSGKKVGDQGYKSALVERKEKEKKDAAQEAGKGYKGGYGFNKGGLVMPRNKQDK